MAPELRHLELGSAFEALLESASAAIVAVDRDGVVLVWNRGAERLFGWTREEALGNLLPPMPEDRREEFRGLRRRVLSGEALEGLAMRHRRRDGTEVPVLLSVRPLRDETGEVDGILGLATEASGTAGVDALAHRVRALELELAETERLARRQGLPAHFLLAILHAASMLLRKGDREEAVHALTQAGGLLRRLAARGGRSEVPLREELELLEEYVALERLRFGGGLRFRLDVEPEAGRALVPGLLLLPIVENAVKHGLAGRSEGGTISIRATREDEELRIAVRDDGRGFPTGWRLDPEDDEGRGLAALSRRMRRLYDGEHRLEVGNGERGGAVVSLALPYRPARSDANGGRPPA